MENSNFKIDYDDDYEGFVDSVNQLGAALRQMREDEKAEQEALFRSDKKAVDALSVEDIDKLHNVIWKTEYDKTKPEHELWNDRYVEVQLASYYHHIDGYEFMETLAIQLCDSNIRALEYQLQATEEYATRQKQQLKDCTGTDPEIIPMQQEVLNKRIDTLRWKYVHIQNCLSLHLEEIRPQLEKLLKISVSPYKSLKQLENERNRAAMYRARKKINLQDWNAYSPQEKAKLLDDSKMFGKVRVK